MIFCNHGHVGHLTTHALNPKPHRSSHGYQKMHSFGTSRGQWAYINYALHSLDSQLSAEPGGGKQLRPPATGPKQRSSCHHHGSSHSFGRKNGLSHSTQFHGSHLKQWPRTGTARTTVLRAHAEVPQPQAHPCQAKHRELKTAEKTRSQFGTCLGTAPQVRIFIPAAFCEPLVRCVQVILNLYRQAQNTQTQFLTQLKSSTKTVFQFFLFTIKHYLLRALKERRLLLKGPCLRRSIRLTQNVKSVKQCKSSSFPFPRAFSHSGANHLSPNRSV